ncbi:hypothetical protein TYRP_013400 [Tyrophagus putrescentiae]|nr:hypothetical protein TYRP_013400 [Tyrophagus putrescentiae]
MSSNDSNSTNFAKYVYKRLKNDEKLVVEDDDNYKVRLRVVSSVSCWRLSCDHHRTGGTDGLQRERLGGGIVQRSGVSDHWQVAETVLFLFLLFNRRIVVGIARSSCRAIDSGSGTSAGDLFTHTAPSFASAVIEAF